METTGKLEPIVGKNGVLIDPVTRKFMKGGKPTTAIVNSSQGRELQELRRQRKRERIEAGANAALERLQPGKWDGEDLDFVEAISEAAMRKALDHLDTKQIDAARFLVQEAGIAEPKQTEQASSSPLPQADAALAGLIAAMTERVRAGMDAVDAETQDEADVVGGG